MSQKVHCATFSVSQFLQMCDRVFTAWEYSRMSSVKNGRACPRSQFPVSHPCSKKPEKVSFPNIDSSKPVYLSDGFPYSSPLYPANVQKKRKTYNKPNPRSDLA